MCAGFLYTVSPRGPALANRFCEAPCLLPLPISVELRSSRGTQWPVEPLIGIVGPAKRSVLIIARTNRIPVSLIMFINKIQRRETTGILYLTVSHYPCIHNLYGIPQYFVQLVMIMIIITYQHDQ